MERIDPQVVRGLYRQVSGVLQRWEADASPPQVRALRTTATQVQEQLDAWGTAGVYPSSEMKMLRDAVAHVEARLTLAQQEKSRGY